MTRLQWLAGACVFTVLAASGAGAQAARFTTMASFDDSNGAYPWAQLVLATDGNFYGTTQNGGKNTNCGDGYTCGTVFKVTPAGKLTTIYNFTNSSGNRSYAGLVQGANGNLYGVASSGGTPSQALPDGNGTVFEVTTGGKLTVLHKFKFTDGAFPVGGLMLASDGNFYGTTSRGGSADLGTIFKMTPDGTLTKLKNFVDNGNHGAFPNSTLAQGASGDFYGIASAGKYGVGVAYEYSAKGKYSVLHTFTGNADGGAPYAGLLVGKDGNLYGSTENGGQNVAYGTMFKLTPSGHLTTLHNFNLTDGDVPVGTLIQGTDGNFYGTAAYGGDTPYYGTVFRMTPKGKITTLHSFNLTDGAFAYAGLIQAPNGTLYGDTFGGGSSAACTYGCGTIFSLTLGKK